MCKGSGKREAIPCVECQAPGVIYTAHINSKPSHYCSTCYTEKVGA
jgi:formamidopyrimidine-DNA glycosylase